MPILFLLIRPHFVIVFLLRLHYVVVISFATTWNSRIFPQDLPLGISLGSPLAKTTFLVFADLFAKTTLLVLAGHFAKTTLSIMAASWSFCEDHPLGPVFLRTSFGHDPP